MSMTQLIDRQAIEQAQERVLAHRAAHPDREFMPEICTQPPPFGWEQVEACVFRRGCLQVIVTGAVEVDGRRWIHFSMIHRHRLPTWEELTRAKDAFLGAESKAVQVLPPRSQWVNLHPHCLHLFSCLDAHPLPDFTAGTRSI